MPKYLCELTALAGQGEVLRAGPCGPDPSMGWVGPCARERTPDTGQMKPRWCSITAVIVSGGSGCRIQQAELGRIPGSRGTSVAAVALGVVGSMLGVARVHLGASLTGALGCLAGWAGGAEFCTKGAEF